MKISNPIASAVIAASIAASILTTPAAAQTHTDSFTYQGQFLDNGEPANGFFDMAFNVLDDEFAGSTVPGGFMLVPNVEVIDGNFEAFVDFGTTGLIFDSDQTQWLPRRRSSSPPQVK